MLGNRSRTEWGHLSLGFASSQSRPAQQPQYQRLLVHSTLPIAQLRHSTCGDSWRTLKRTKRVERNHCRRRYKSIQSGKFEALRCLRRWPLTRCSLQDALRTFFQPIKTDDARVDFYTMYKREATEYDTDYVKKYDEDLNTTLIFVRCSSSVPVSHLTCSHRRACSLPSAPRLLSMYIRTSNLIPTSNLRSSSVPSSSLSTNPPSPVRLLPSHLFSEIHRARSSPSPVSCMRVS